MSIPSHFVSYFKNYPSVQLVNHFLDCLKLFFRQTQVKPQHQNWASNLLATQTGGGSHFVFQLIFNNKEIFRQEIAKGSIQTQILVLKEEPEDIEDLELSALNQLLTVHKLTANHKFFLDSTTQQQWLYAIDAIQQHYRKIKRQQQHQALFYELATTASSQLFSERKKLIKELELLQQYKGIIKQSIQTFLKTKEAQTIITAEEFYFEHAKTALSQIRTFDANKNFYQKFLTRYQEFEGSYIEFIQHLSKRSKQRNWAELLGQFLAYADSKLAKESAWNSYTNHRFFSEQTVRLQSWLQALTELKIKGKVSKNNIKASLAYLETPTTQLPLFSAEEHKLIAQNLLYQSFQSSLFVENLLTYFASFKELETTNPKNQTYLIAKLLAIPTITDIWKFTDEDTYQGELMDKIIAEPLPQYYLAQSDVPLNQILYGPPGTGKTYRSIREALSIVEQKTRATLEKEAQITLQKRFEDYLDRGQIVFTTFHQAMSYEDFVEGIKPFTKNGRVVYEIQDGLFKQVALRALDNPSNTYALIIDEINRGNIANILGELITLLEADKRLNQANQISTQLPYSKTIFSLPSNLYIIGTMNTTDRSTEILDAALRRRFVFVETSPEYDLLSEDIEGVNLQLLLQAMNKRIKTLLDKTYMIGHAYFMYITDLDSLNKVFANQILPLLEDYFYNDYGKIGLVLGKSFVQWGEDPDSIFADFNYQGIDRFWEQKTYQLRPLPLPKEAYIAVYK